MKDNKIESKIKKLLALSTSDNKSEADAAYKKASELMIKHNIEIIKEEEPNFEINERFYSRTSQEAKYVFQIIIKCFFCVVLRKRVWKEPEGILSTRYSFIGESTNVSLAMYAFDYLISEFKRKWVDYKKKHRLPSNAKQSFYFGLVLGFRDTFKVQKNYCEEKYALIIPNVDPRLDEFIKENLNVSKKSHKDSLNTNCPNVFEDGYKQGKDITISRTIEHDDQSNKTLLIA